MKRACGKAIGLAFLGLALCLASPAATWYVAVTGSDTTGDGSPGNPYRTIGKGLSAAAGSDTVSVGPGTYAEAVVMKSGVSLVSQQGASATVIEAGGAARGVQIYECSAATLVRGFTIRGAQTGCASWRSSARIDACIVTGNTGALYCGGIILQDSYAPVVENCLVYGNTSQYAAGIRVEYAPVTATIRHCTIYGNTATDGGDGGISMFFGAVATVESCIIRGNGATEILGSGATITYSDVEGGYTGTGNVDADPLFWDAAGGDFRLRYGSFCAKTGASGSDMGCYPTLTVGASGSDCTTVQAACTALPSLSQGPDHAGSVHVKPGTYSEHVTMQPRTLLEGAGAGSSILDGGGTDRCVTMAPHGVLSRLTVQNGSTQYGSGAFGADPCAVSQCVFKNNQATVGNSQGGGVYLPSGTGRVVNCLFYGNNSEYGGAIYAYAGSFTVLNCTFADNDVGVSWYRGGIHAYGTIAAPCTVTVANSILWNDGDELSTVGSSATITSSYCDIEDGDTGTGNIASNPQFCDSAGGDYRVKSGSPCIDSGTNAGAPPDDLLGCARPQDGNLDGSSITDMGAYEDGPGLLYNPSFTTGDLYNWNLSALASSGTATVADYWGRSRTFRSYRPDVHSGAATTLEQPLAIPCTSASSLTFKFAIVAQTFTGSLDNYQEFPAKVFLYYLDSTGAQHEIHRYYYIAGTSSDTNAELVSSTVWHNRSIDLSALSPAPVFFTRVVLQSQGWGWETYFDDLGLFAQTLASDGARPSAGTFTIDGGAALTSSPNVTLGVTQGVDAPLYITSATLHYGGPTIFAQGFVATSGAVTGARIRIDPVDAGALHVVSLRRDLSGPDVASFSVVIASAGEQDISGYFPFPVNTRPGTTLYLVLSRQDGQTHKTWALISDADPYPQGALWDFTASAWYERLGFDMNCSIYQWTQRVQVSNDAFATSGFANYATSIPWTLGAGDGAKTVRMRYVDLAGNESAATVERTITLDTTPPSSAVTFPPDAYYGFLTCNTPLVVQGTASDATSGVSGVECSWDDGATWHAATNTGTGFSTWSCSWPTPTQGHHQIRSRASDAASNEETPGAGNDALLHAVGQFEWLQTSQADFQSDLLTNIDTTSAPGSCRQGTATVTYDSAAQFSGTQGYDQWNYRRSDGADLAWNGSWWGSASDAQIKSDRQMGYGSLNSSREWVAPSAGGVRIVVGFQDAEAGAPTTSWTWLIHNYTQLYQQIIANGDFTPYGTTVNRSVEAGDRLKMQTYDTPVNQWILTTMTVDFRPAGTVLSRVVDSGAAGTQWRLVSWDPSSQPANTSIAVAVRASDAPFAQDAGSPAWVVITNGQYQEPSIVTGRYAQYRAVLSASDLTSSAQLDEFRLIAPDNGTPYSIDDLNAQKSGCGVHLTWSPNGWIPAVSTVRVYRATQKDLSDKVHVADATASGGTYTDTPPDCAAPLYFYHLTTYDEACREGN